MGLGLKYIDGGKFSKWRKLYAAQVVDHLIGFNSENGKEIDYNKLEEFYNELVNKVYSLPKGYVYDIRNVPQEFIGTIKLNIWHKKRQITLETIVNNVSELIKARKSNEDEKNTKNQKKDSIKYYSSNIFNRTFKRAFNWFKNMFKQTSVDADDNILEKYLATDKGLVNIRFDDTETIVNLGMMAYVLKDSLIYKSGDNVYGFDGKAISRKLSKILKAELNKSTGLYKTFYQWGLNYIFNKLNHDDILKEVYNILDHLVAYNIIRNDPKGQYEVDLNALKAFYSAVSNESMKLPYGFVNDLGRSVRSIPTIVEIRIDRDNYKINVKSTSIDESNCE